MVAVGLPVVVDGATVDTGTPFDAADREGCEDAINAIAHSTTNPTETPAGIIDEIVELRGSTGSANGRVENVIDSAGNPVSTIVTRYNLGQLFLKNLIINDLLECWSQGDTSAPDGWELTGAGASIARTGAGLADTRAPLIGRWCAKVTAGGGAAAYLRQKIVPASVMAYLYQLGQFLTEANATGGQYKPRLAILGQGWGVTAGDVNVFGLVDSQGETLGYQPHAGGSAWERMPGEGGLPGLFLVGDNVYVGYKIAAGKSAYCGPMVSTFCPPQLDVQALVTLAIHIPCDVVRDTKEVHFIGSPGTGARKWSWAPRRPGIITDATPYAGTAPGAGGLVFDVNTYDGAAFTTAFTTKPTCANGVSYGPAVAPDGTYARRCFFPKHTAALAAGALVTVDIDAENSAANYGLTIGYLTWQRPFDALFPFDQV